MAALTPPHPTSAANISLENAPSDADDDAPVPSSQTATAYEEIENFIKESITIVLKNAPSVPVTRAQTAVAYEEMKDAIKESIENTHSDDDAPLSPTQIAAAYEEIDNAMNDATTKATKGKPEPIEDGDAPHPAAIKSKEIDNDNELSYEDDASKKPPASLANQGLRQGQDDVTVPLSSPVPQVVHGQVIWPPPESVLIPNRNESRTSSVPTKSHTSRTDQTMENNQNPPSSGQNQAAAIITSSPPRSILPRTSDSGNTSSVPMLEATLVQGVEATLIVPNNEPVVDMRPVYNAVQVWEDHDDSAGQVR